MTSASTHCCGCAAEKQGSAEYVRVANLGAGHEAGEPVLHLPAVALQLLDALSDARVAHEHQGEDCRGKTGGE